MPTIEEKLEQLCLIKEDVSDIDDNLGNNFSMGQIFELIEKIEAGMSVALEIFKEIGNNETAIKNFTEILARQSKVNAIFRKLFSSFANDYFHQLKIVNLDELNEYRTRLENILNAKQENLAEYARFHHEIEILKYTAHVELDNIGNILNDLLAIQNR